MAARNVKQAAGLYDPAEKLQSNTLKRHPKMDLNKADLLRLLSYLEGELQARDVVIATLKAEKAKQLLYQAKYGRFGLGDPFQALQRDSDNMKDNTFDESAIKSMYDNQLAQLENLIATQRKAQIKMREQLATAEKRYHKVCSELEDEKRKHAQDTAQGDDVTYMLEKERERLRQEIDYEKGQNKKLEKDLKKTLASLEEERANSVKHKQVAVMLIKEQKKLIERLVIDRQKCNQYDQLLKDEKNKTITMAEGLVQESKKSLKMEASMEKQLSDFDLEREQLKNRLGKSDIKNKELQSQVDILQMQVDALQKQLMSAATAAKDSLQNIEVKAMPSPARAGTERLAGATVTVVSPMLGKPVPKSSKPLVVDGGVRISEDRPYSPAGIGENAVLKTVRYGVNSPARSPERGSLGGGESSEMRVGPVGAVSIDKSENYRGVGTRIGIAPGTSAVISSGGKMLTVNVASQNANYPNIGAANTSPRKMVPLGRGTPPPLPPNKPVLNSPVPGKPAPPPKVGVSVCKDTPIDSSNRTTPKAVHIPVSVVHGSGGAGRQSAGTDSSSPMRKPAQLTPEALDVVTTHDVTPPLTSSSSGHAPVNSQLPATALEFLGPEMADLQQLLSSIMTDSDHPHHLAPSPSPALPNCPSNPADIVFSPIHKRAHEGDQDALRQLILDREADVNLPLKDGTTPLLCSAESGHQECVSLLLDQGANPNTSRDNKYSPLHAAAAQGHRMCVQVLLERGAIPNLTDHQGWTPLHLAATQGHTDCCKILLDYGAQLTVYSNTSWTPLHCVVHPGHVDCLHALLTYDPRSPHRDPPGSPSTVSQSDGTVQRAINMADKDGWTVVFVAAIRPLPDCLAVIMNMCDVNVQRKDRWGRTIMDVASVACKEFIQQRSGKDLLLTVTLEIQYPNLSEDFTTLHLPSQKFVIGSLSLEAGLSWAGLETRLQHTLTNYFSQIDTGLRTKRTSRLDPEIAMDNVQYSLGLDLECINMFSIGGHKWELGSHSNTLPHSIVRESNQREITIILANSVECVAWDVLFPVSVIHNYIRLLEHYKSVVFYGPEKTGKTYLAHRLAHLIARKEKESGKVPQIHSIVLHESFCHRDLVNLLQSTGCMVREGMEADDRAPILILDDLEKVDVAVLFGKLLGAIEHRGQFHTFTVEGDDQARFYFLDSFYIIASMNKSRSTGLDLNIQQRFRWVHFRIDIEPIRNLLARHLLRNLIHIGDGQLPVMDNMMFRAVEWIVCVWQRLNDGVAKLGLPDVMFGPYQFIMCPLHSQDPNTIYNWLSGLWNNLIAPTVKVAVVKGTGKDTSSDGQQKVANTALYVLMQKAVVPGCPLSGPGKEQYLSMFAGSNELDIPMKQEKMKASNSPHHRRSLDSSKGMFNRIKHRNSYDTASRDQSQVQPHPKRRSLSELSNRSQEDYDTTDARAEEGSNSSLAKVPKLEIRSPVLSIPFPAPGSAPVQTSDRSQTAPVFTSNNSGLTSERGVRSFSMSSQSSSLSSGKKFTSHLPIATRKSRSSENLSSTYGSGSSHSRMTPHLRSPSPFSFSLTTPTSALNSFKFLEVKSRAEVTQTKRGSRRSLDSSLAQPRKIPEPSKTHLASGFHHQESHC
ncbi:cortactin-binding protein 2-like isoform X2 [Mizuhopecten yessoensis]|uniref:Cortactin-binding protein 2 n=1 Tax=Mizuhopecten yessoensis TaxID=6573 RepID=A0A210Q4C0_MIZYE|nr:cortactin-binding protein 2-like isoform X2 [Mizuhopecten yessoensis]OWF43588.1 Cortactin-binding protein 2 [Mizuhopecten yessoensis]